ncbi:MAG TPA: MFS transporter [Candidatus Moranbacteria bacterium]|nr:MFS transporter [Candidatus Moranbacteria bacterium]HSA08483.1 MFS transporter [Candidatus Moranbacteria bacterium]
MAGRTKKHLEHVDKKKLEMLSFISFLFGFSQAILAYVIADYFKEAFGSTNVSVFYFISYAIALIGILNMHKIIKKLGKATAMFLFLFLQVCSVTFLVFSSPSIIGVILLMSYIIASYLAWVMLDVIVEDYSEDKKSGRIRGMHLTILNAGFVIGPFISTQVLEKFGFNGLFFVAMIISMFMFVVAILGLRNDNQRFGQNLTIRDLMKKIFVNKDVMKIYAVSLALEFFFALMVVYTSLYLLELGMSWSKIGIIFTIMLVPFVILGYPVGLLADKKLGEKEMIIFGLVIMAISSASIFFITSTSIWVWSLILFATRIGATIIETLRDSYFYKKIDGRDVDIISFFRTTPSIAYILATTISAVILIFFPLKSVFLLVALAAFLAIFAAVRLVDNKSEKEM